MLMRNGMSPFDPAIPAPLQSAHRLDPAENLLHPFAYPLAGLIAAPAAGAPVESSYLHVVLAGNVRSNGPLAAAVHKIFPVVAFVGSNGFGRNTLMQFLVGVHLPQGHQRFGFGNGIV